jgi:TPR repeat protein
MTESAEALALARTALRSDIAGEQARGVRLIEELAATGNAEAVYALGTWYLHGAHGFKKDLRRARRLIKSAAERLVPAALYDLAEFVDRDRAVISRKRKAYNLYLASALLGDADALDEIIRRTYWGEGTFENREAVKILYKIKDAKQAALTK